jgi:signal transduction histidine kinase
MRIRLAVLLWGVLVGAFTLKVAQEGAGFSTTEGTWGGAALLLAAGWSLSVASAVALSRRSRRTFAVLLTLTTTAWFVSEWANPAGPALSFTAGLFLGAATPALVFVSALAAVDWLRVRSARAIAVAGLVLAGVVGLLGATSFDPRTSGCPDCPANLAAIGHDPAVWLEVSRFGLRAATVWLGAAVLVLGWWFVRAGERGRRDATWQVLAAGAFLTLELVRTIRSLDTGFLTSDAESRLLWRFQAVALVALAIAVVADVVRTRRAERSLTRVVRGLAAGDELVAGLAQRLGDQHLAVAFPSADGTGLLDAHGEPVAPLDGSSRSWTPIGPAEAPIAVFGHRADISPGRVRELASAVHLALDHQRLQAQALAQLDELRRSGSRIVVAGDAERRRLEHDLHDGAQQNLVIALIGVRAIRQRAPDDPALTAAEQHLKSAVERLRTVAHGLYPVLLERAGLATALCALSETRLLRLGPLPDARLDPVIESTAYLLVERATSRSPSSVTVCVSADQVRIEVSMEGQCPDLDALSDRIAALDGTITVADGDPSVVVASLPRRAAT